MPPSCPAAEEAQARLEAQRRADDLRIEAAARARAELRARWGLHRWTQQSEEDHLQELQARERLQNPAPAPGPGTSMPAPWPA
jgi:hypothetical protein